MLNTVGIIVVIIIIVFLIYILHTKSLDSFIVLLDDIVIPKDCYDYLVSNGSQFFLINTKKMLNGTSNPIAFNTKADAIKFLSTSTNCPDNIPFVDLTVKKKIEDPTVSYQRECNKKVSPKLFDLDVCGTYGSDADSLSGKIISRINKIENDKSIYANYDIETCMINKAIIEEPALDDTNFKDYFAKYFDRLNSGIDEEYLYISGR